MVDPVPKLLQIVQVVSDVLCAQAKLLFTSTSSTFALVQKLCQGNQENKHVNSLDVILQSMKYQKTVNDGLMLYVSLN